MRVKRASQERVLHFKDGVNWHEYNEHSVPAACEKLYSVD
ncbi:Uncharacterised protein [Klebsiella pneumoniae]|uniref:Uncharacterized protein n=1 Tax=Klebsiella pneumoniae TaxID=573 RepID=A0A377XE73_KLEPN|nr:Uncharacterised protein [Klebsiella pneumoniae]